jgi:hypothetical protein
MKRIERRMEILPLMVIYKHSIVPQHMSVLFKGGRDFAKKSLSGHQVIQVFEAHKVVEGI